MHVLLVASAPPVVDVKAACLSPTHHVAEKQSMLISCRDTAMRISAMYVFFLGPARLVVDVEAASVSQTRHVAVVQSLLFSVQQPCTTS